jgi:transposase InsO family protein
MESDPKLVPQVMGLLVKSVLLAARWAGEIRRQLLVVLANSGIPGTSTEVLALREQIRQLESQVAILRRQLRTRAVKKHYTLRERLDILWHLETFQIPRRRVTEVFGIARSTLYRWLQRIEDVTSTATLPPNKTPEDLARWVWDIATANAQWGRDRIGHQLLLLEVFLAASTVRRILARPRPPKEPVPAKNASATPTTAPEPQARSVAAFHPNHVWSVDRTIVRRWGLWTTYVLVAIDHFSRKAILAAPLAGPNAAHTCQALEDAFFVFGSPKHIITDKESVFTGAAFAELLSNCGVMLRHGAVGKHGSIAVTERLIRTLKHEWLFRAPVIKGFDHLTRLCADFVVWYNAWRPHARYGGFTPDQVFARDLPEHVPKTAKSVPLNVERRLFEETNVTAYRLKRAA